MVLDAADKTALDAALTSAKQQALDQEDRKYLLTKILGRAPFPREIGEPGEFLAGALAKKADRADHLRNWKHLRQFEGHESKVSYAAWRKGVEPLLADAEVPSDVKREIILNALSGPVYNMAVQHGYATAGDENALVAALDIDWQALEDPDALTCKFYELVQTEKESVLAFLQRVRTHAEDLKSLIGPAFNSHDMTLKQMQRGCRDEKFLVKLAVEKPTDSAALVKLAKAYVQFKIIKQNLITKN